MRVHDNQPRAGSGALRRCRGTYKMQSLAHLTFPGGVQISEVLTVLSSSCRGIVGRDSGEDPHLPRAEVQ